MSEMDNLRECAIGKLGTAVKTDVNSQVGKIEDVVAALPVLYRVSRETGVDIGPTLDAAICFVNTQLRSIESVAKVLSKMLHDSEESLSAFRTVRDADSKGVLQGMFPDVVTNFGNNDAEEARKWTDKLHRDGVIDGDGNPRFDSKPKSARRTGRKASKKADKASPAPAETEK